MSELNNIPKDWKRVKLGEYVISVKGKKPKRISPIKTKECSIPYVNIKAFEKNQIDEYTDGTGCVLCEEGDFLMVWDGSRSGYVGKAITGALGSTLVKLNFPNINNDYAYYFLQSKYIEINTRAKGVGIPHVDPHLLWNYDLLIPDEKTQKAIVIKIEELFGAIENGKHQLETVQQQLKVYRQAVLKWAFEGRLTNKNINGELPKKWRTVELKHVAEKISDGPFGSHLKSADYVNEGIRVIRLENIGEMEFRDEHKTFISQEKYETIKSHTVGSGDIIFSSFISENIRSVILPDYIEKAVNKADCFLVRVSEQKILKKYLAFYFSTRAMQNQLVNHIHGATRPRINTSQLKTSLIPFAPLEEQRRIVQEIESRLSVCDKIEEMILKNLQHLEILKQSILNKAFEGKLVAVSHPLSKEVKQLIKTAAQISSTKARKFPIVLSGMKETDLHAGILSMVIDAHEKSSKHLAKLNHVKGEKIAHLVEYKLGISLGRNPVKDAAGPDDYNHLKKVEHRATKACFFKIQKQSIGHTYKSLRGMQAHIQKTKQALGNDRFNAVTDLIQTFLKFEMEHAEVIATLYAGWNNLLITGKNPTDEEIVYESRENWSKRKLTIDRDKFFKTLGWMKQHGFVPEGKGQMVLKKEEVKKEKKKKTTIKKKNAR